MKKDVSCYNVWKKNPTFYSLLVAYNTHKNNLLYFPEQLQYVYV